MAAAAGAAAGFFLLAHDADSLLPFMVVVWLGTCALDMGYTLKHGSLARRHERNPILQAASRFGGLRAGAAMTLAAEIGLIVSAPLIILHEWDARLFGVMCGAAACVHATGFLENRRFVRQRRACC